MSAAGRAAVGSLITRCRLQPERTGVGTYLISDVETGLALEMDAATFLNLAQRMWPMATETHHPER